MSPFIEALYEGGLLSYPGWRNVFHGRFDPCRSHATDVKLNQEIRKLLLSTSGCETPTPLGDLLWPFQESEDGISESWRSYWSCSCLGELDQLMTGWLTKRMI